MRLFLEECAVKINSYLGLLQYQSISPSEFKIAGAFIFWLRKLKPFYFVLEEGQQNPVLFLNEYIAIMYGYIYLNTARNESHSLNQSFIEDLAIQLRYSAFSPSSVAMLLESRYT